MVSRRDQLAFAFELVQKRTQIVEHLVSPMGPVPVSSPRCRHPVWCASDRHLHGAATRGQGASRSHGRAAALWKWSEKVWQTPDLDWRKADAVTVVIDVGSVSSQAVLLADGKLLAFCSTRTGSSSSRGSRPSRAAAARWRGPEPPSAI